MSSSFCAFFVAADQQKRGRSRWASRTTSQGDPLIDLVRIGIAPSSERSPRQDASERIFAYLDDLHVICRQERFV